MEKIRQKINMDYAQLVENGPITIVAFGDSVTHGAVGPDEIDYETVYWNRLRKKIYEIRDYVPVNIINAGIGGVTAATSIARLERDVLRYDPDLVIVCFGLNDVNGPLEEYLNSLHFIFEKIQKQGIGLIFMTPNMLNTYVADDVENKYRDYAATTAKMQNEGQMDLYMNKAVALATEMSVPVCDCYKEWKRINETQDITQLLANRINHPNREMHNLFAERLFQMIFPSKLNDISSENSTMYKRKDI